MKVGIPIDEAVSLLNDYAPQTLTRLRRELPAEIQPLLEAGGLAAAVGPMLKSRAIVANAALAETIPLCDRAIATAEKRLRNARRLRLVGEIAAILGSSSVLGSVSVAATKWLIPSGFVALIGSVAAILSDHSIKLPMEGQGSLFETYAQLAECRFEAKQLLREISALQDIAETDEKTLDVLIGSANALARKVQQLLPRLLSS